MGLATLPHIPRPGGAIQAWCRGRRSGARGSQEAWDCRRCRCFEGPVGRAGFTWKLCTHGPSETLRRYFRLCHLRQPSPRPRRRIVSVRVPKPGVAWLVGHCSSSGCFLPMTKDTVGEWHHLSKREGQGSFRNDSSDGPWTLQWARQEVMGRARPDGVGSALGGEAGRGARYHLGGIAAGGLMEQQG